jgi:RNA polymerase sigma-70 factor (ECF subfamily)
MSTDAAVGVTLPPSELISVAATFEDTYRREYPGLVAVARALTGDFRDGEDAVQDTMVKAFTRWSDVGEFERPGAWCHRVLLSVCRGRWRRKRTEELFWARRRREERSVPEPSADVMVFWSLVRDLPSRPRLSVTLHFAGERTMADIASILGVPEGTVRSDIARARVVITTALEARS